MALAARLSPQSPALRGGSLWDRGAYDLSPCTQGTGGMQFSRPVLGKSGVESRRRTLEGVGAQVGQAQELAPGSLATWEAHVGRCRDQAEPITTMPARKAVAKPHCAHTVL